MRPTFIISLDEELVWGSFDHTAPARFAERYPDLRGVVRELLRVFDRHDVPATWAIVGHLFLHSCTRGADGRAHPELLRPRHAWFQGDWLSQDPCTDRTRDPLWYGDDLVDLVRGARVAHEIGCHSFSHVVYGDVGCTEAVAESDLSACLEAARPRGIVLRSFVFPRNAEGHHGVLQRHGFAAYRGEDPSWYRTLPGTARRAAHLFDQAAALPPPVTEPSEKLPGLWNFPGSMLLLHTDGVRRLIPFASRVLKARAGLRRAIRERKLFHLWFHPFNVARHRDGMLDTLDAILADAARLRDRGELDIMTMGGLAKRCCQHATTAAS
jgi:peptidoglycan/xylan/chitin deacetylase (PgdA/CDA1 family)